MLVSTEESRVGRRRLALLGLAGAALTAVSDMLILARPCSGSQFDRAEGQIPPHMAADPRWRSLWNGARLSPRRIHVGTIPGLVGIGLLQWLGLHGLGGAVRSGALRTVASASAAAFAVSGVATHLCCGRVILAYRRAAALGPGSADASRSAGTALLGISAVASLGALAVFSGAITLAGLRGHLDAQRPWSLVTPFPCVAATLLTFGALPAPVGGYARPASISLGLMAYFASAAASPRGGQGTPLTASSALNGSVTI